MSPGNDTVPSIPANLPAPGTVDLTNVVEAVRSSFVTFAVTFIEGAAATSPATSWLLVPVIRQAFHAGLTWAIGALSKAVEMQAFFLNTTLRKQGQAADFVQAVDALAALPKTASKEEYANAEKLRMDAFRRFVMVTN